MVQLCLLRQPFRLEAPQTVWGAAPRAMDGEALATSEMWPLLQVAVAMVAGPELWCPIVPGRMSGSQVALAPVRWRCLRAEERLPAWVDRAEEPVLAEAMAPEAAFLAKAPEQAGKGLAEDRIRTRAGAFHPTRVQAERDRLQAANRLCPECMYAVVTLGS